ncbi:hypothetical protein F5Y13DRAFT_192891 [Hypoxylon sp. FL1857]|nr:hypothetical protein F5Y13DRAFT_192891 [Hypoxylon sp. FL1857]
MGVGILFVGFLLMGSSLRTCKAEIIPNSTMTVTKAFNTTKWQPNNFPWEEKRALSGAKETWKGLYVNLTENKHAAAVLTPDVAHFRTSTGRNISTTTDLAVIEPHEHFLPALAWFAGMSWATAGEIALTGLTILGTISAIQGCVTDDGSAWGNFNCVVGILGSVVGIGQAARGAYAGIKALGWFARSSPKWLATGLDAIELAAFAKRELHPERYQILHERLISHALNQTFGESEFIGYASEDHRLGARHDEHLHPLAPIFRFRHPRHGLMDVAAREHISGTRFTITYANGLEKRGLDHLGRRQSFQHEALNGAILEARFDEEAAQADPCNPTFDAANAFDQLENEIKCFTNGNWPDGSVLKAQIYDSSCEATMGFVHMAFFENNSTAEVLQNMKPAGMPLPECGST